MARLLAALAEAPTARAIIDPMVGSGDMLQACLDIGAKPEQLVGVDVDHLAVQQARQRFANCEVTLEARDAFAGPLPVTPFDLVITNPPYIRYQSNPGLLSDVTLPSAGQVRRNLQRTIRTREHLSEGARQALLQAAAAYPGNADIAVPAWILAASLVAETGVLAVVVPQTWLSRNYAAAIRRLLDTIFDVDIVIEDADGSWFDDAQVRTHLIVARRRSVTGHGPRPRSRVRARATEALRHGELLIGALADEEAVAQALREWDSPHESAVTTGLRARQETSPLYVGGNDELRLPDRLASVLPTTDVLISLGDLGWSAGQGMRTGANDVFYLDRDNTGRCLPAVRWGGLELQLPVGTTLSALRRQSQLPAKLSVASADLDTVLLQLAGWATAADRTAAVAAGHSGSEWDERFGILDDTMAAWLALVAQTPLNSSSPDRLIPSLTAVAPNVRTTRAGAPTAYWYHLPALAPRHRPDLIFPRVCGSRPSAYANPDRVVVDANFSSLWQTDPAGIHPDALLAALNSTWVWAFLELTCTVLGGGALKIEAADLRRLPLPPLMSIESELVAVGREFAAAGRHSAVQQRVDSLMAEVLGVADTESFQAWVHQLAEDHWADRAPRGSQH